MRILGIDSGSASIGWAVIESGGADCEEVSGTRIIAAGVRMYQSVEEKGCKTPRLKSTARRLFRSRRRMIHRRVQRMNRIRALFYAHKLIASPQREALFVPGLDPWLLRAQGLDRCLMPQEWAIALGHIVLHRGFKTLRAAHKIVKDATAVERRVHLGKWRSVGEMFAYDEQFKERKRNRGAHCTYNILRAEQEAEVALLFERQRHFGNRATCAEFYQSYCRLAFSQLPIIARESYVGACRFEAGERRTTRFSPSFERFRFLVQLTILRLEDSTSNVQRALNTEEIGLCFNNFGTKAHISYAHLRALLDLADGIHFSGITREHEHQDIVTQNGAAWGSFSFYECLVPIIGHEASIELLACSELDRVAEHIGLNKDWESLHDMVSAMKLAPQVKTGLIDGFKLGRFNEFKGIAHLSAKAARKLIPFLSRGYSYAHACAAVGFNDVVPLALLLSDIRAPSICRMLSENLKQIKMLMAIYGPFDAIHVEMARSGHKNGQACLNMHAKFQELADEKSQLSRELSTHFPQHSFTPRDLLAYSLWKEQEGRCLYSNRPIDLPALFSSDNCVQIDHIVPLAHGGHDRAYNKTLCFSEVNFAKGANTPYQWLMRCQPHKWADFVKMIMECPNLTPAKRRNYLQKDHLPSLIPLYAPRLQSQALYYTRYMLKLLLRELKCRYFPHRPHNVKARSSEITAQIRAMWGLDSYKKDHQGQRIADDRHHALDALVVALTDESLLQFMIKHQQIDLARRVSLPTCVSSVPWPSFHQDVATLYKGLLVSRAEIRRARGKIHKATLKQLRMGSEGLRSYERKLVENLNEKDLDRLPMPKAYGHSVQPENLQMQLRQTLSLWIKAGKPKEQHLLPRSVKGDIVRKIRVESTHRPGLILRGGCADRAEIIRVDVFAHDDLKVRRRFYFVPVYRHHLREREPPHYAVKPGCPEKDWIAMTQAYQFCFSLYPLSLVKVRKRCGTVLFGYFRCFDRWDASITLSSIENQMIRYKGIGTGTLQALDKFSIDRLGRVSQVEVEKRSWQGRRVEEKDEIESIDKTLLCL